MANITVGLNNGGPLDLLSAESRTASGGAMNVGSTPNKKVPILAGDSLTLLNTSAGPGYLSDLWMAFDTLGVNDFADMAITVTVDGNVLYTGDQQLFFAAQYWTAGTMGPGPAAFFSNDFVQNMGGQKLSIPIPFTSSLEIVITNNHPSTVNIWFTLGYATGIKNEWPRCKKLNIRHGSVVLSQDQVLDVINETGIGRGRLFGLYFVWQGFLSSSPAFLEGPITITFDGSVAYKSSGSEDYFGAAGYFAAISAGQGNRMWSLTIKRTDPLLYAAMRFHLGEPMNFENDVLVQLAAGDSSSGITFTGTVNIFYMAWFYTDV